MKKINLLFLVVIMSLCLVACGRDDDVTSVNKIDDNVNLDNGDEFVDWNSLNTSNIKLDNKSLNINDDGIYMISGTINNGSIIVNAKGDVKLILDNVSITNDSGPAIIIESANNTVIEMTDDSVNFLEDGNSYDNQEYDGCIYSRDDLVLQGNGTLKVNSKYADGIVSNDDLKIVSGNYIIESNDDGIRGKDSVYIEDGNITINSVADGIKSTNDTDIDKGFIKILAGDIKIISGEDGIQAQTKLIINSGNINIQTSDGSGSSATAIDRYFYGGSMYDDTSTKGLKSEDNLIIKGGIIEINSSDDSIHSNNYVGISGGSINISSGDDGVHADSDIVIDGGTITIKKSYEGMEAGNIIINNGDINIVSNDDGINISGGNDNSSMNGRPGQNNMSADYGTLTINNGKIKVDATGDGLDANGNIILNGGYVYVNGPTDNGNGPLDYDTSFDINGGEFIAVGSSGMAQTASSSSKQYSVMFNLSSTYSEVIKLVDSESNIIFEYTPSKKYQSVLISSNKIDSGDEYTLIIDGDEIDTIKVDSITNVSGNSFGMGNMPGGKQPGRSPVRR